jgi:hypothetical protein
MSILLVGWVGEGQFGGGSGWVSDGASADTYWSSSILDTPVAALFANHCHGRVGYEIQFGATGPPHNPCLQITRPGGSLSIEYVVDLPEGGGLWRYSVNGGPWTYYVGNRTWAWPPGLPTPAGGLTPGRPVDI